MKFYLRYVNPVVAAAILALCIWAASKDGHSPVKFVDLLGGGIGSYFLAKGLFCGGSLFLTGFALLARLESGGSVPLYSKRDLVATLVATVVAIGLGGLGIHGLVGKDAENDGKCADFRKIENPSGLVLSRIATVPSSRNLRITGWIRNTDSSSWDKVRLSAKVFVGGVYSDEINGGLDSLRPGEERVFVLQSDALASDRITDSLRYKVETVGLRHP